MALTKCQECSGQVSSKAATCPHCGFPQAQPHSTGASRKSADHSMHPAASINRRLAFTAVIVAILAVLGVVLYNAGVIRGTSQSIAFERVQVDYTRNVAKLAAIKTDLRNIMTAQEAYFADFKAYAPDLPRLSAATGQSVSYDNTVTIIGTTDGYSATAKNPSITEGFKQCSVLVGGGVASTIDGLIQCK